MTKSFAPHSLQALRERIDLVDVLSPFIMLKRSGAVYKALCPFHDEKTPSFIVKKGDTHYHCFGCGAHGDALSFLMMHQSFSFAEAVEYLADKFGVHLEYSDQEASHNVEKRTLKEAMAYAAHFYHVYLLYSDEGRGALEYLYGRGMDLQFIKMFRIGLSPNVPGIFYRAMRSNHITENVLVETGLVKINEGKRRDFFIDRIMFPIQDAMGATIGFSARKYKTETFGPKYVNTMDTPLFKKSHLLFGLSYCRKDIVKEKKAIVVEGQIDALRLIYRGFTTVVAAQGTAFGAAHVQILMHLGVQKVYLALDGDAAGREATFKIGNLFQKEAIEVMVVQLPLGNDPDKILIEEGPDRFERYLEESMDYLHFIIEEAKKKFDMQSPTQKNAMVNQIVKQIREWEHPLLIHESLRKLAQLTNTPENILGTEEKERSSIVLAGSQSLFKEGIRTEMEIEADLMRWLFFSGQNPRKLATVAKLNILPEHFSDPLIRSLYEKYMQKHKEQESFDFLSLGTLSEEEQLLIAKLMHKKIYHEKEEIFMATIQKLLDRQWLQKREAIKQKIQNGQCSEEEAFALAKEFDSIKKERPKILLPNED
ncbi:MAG: DNA primase [Parachlamydiales bacterium]|nr:DNA primase [Parachlamydiales bacterium]